jgi:cysteine desulfurase
MKEIYLDNSATTRLCCSSVKAMMDIMENNYGNPSSLHSMGHLAEKAVDRARRQILGALGAKERD